MHHGKIFRCAQPTSGLGNPVDGLGDNANHRLAVRADDVGARWLPAVDDLAVYEFALKIGSCTPPALPTQACRKTRSFSCAALNSPSVLQ